jgi:hypothetical protein
MLGASLRQFPAPDDAHAEAAVFGIGNRSFGETRIGAKPRVCQRRMKESHFAGRRFPPRLIAGICRQVPEVRHTPKPKGIVRRTPN